jgi:hypothetical protein
MVESARICESLAMTAAMIPAPSSPASQTGAYRSSITRITSSPAADRRRAFRSVSVMPEDGAAARARRASSFCSIAGTSRIALAATPRKTQGSQIASMQRG